MSSNDAELMNDFRLDAMHMQLVKLFTFGGQTFSALFHDQTSISFLIVLGHAFVGLNMPICL